jgi:hypothetical protein
MRQTPSRVPSALPHSRHLLNQFGLGHAALLINEELVLHVVDDIKRRYGLANITTWPARHNRRRRHWDKLLGRRGARAMGRRR